MSRLLVFGLGYTARRLSNALRDKGWRVVGTTRDGRGGSIAFHGAERVRAEIAAATHILSSVPPEGEIDPVLAAYRDPIATAGVWTGYLSSTGVYGDTGGGWVDESAPTGSGRRGARAAADGAWCALGARVFRLPGIYGPGRSPLDRVRDGRAHRVGLPGQVFSRIHVDDIVSGVMAGLSGPAGAYNLADNLPCDQDQVVAYAAALLGLPLPPVVPIESLSPMARGFYAENRRVSALKAKRVLGWVPRHPDYRFGLRALSATTSPAPVNTAPAIASVLQR